MRVSSALAGSLHAWWHAPQRKVWTSGLAGTIRRPESDPHSGQMAGKINAPIVARFGRE
jgi:hypothetical protein